MIRPEGRDDCLNGRNVCLVILPLSIDLLKFYVMTPSFISDHYSVAKQEMCSILHYIVTPAPPHPYISGRIVCWIIYQEEQLFFAIHISCDDSICYHLFKICYFLNLWNIEVSNQGMDSYICMTVSTWRNGRSYSQNINSRFIASDKSNEEQIYALDCDFISVPCMQ